MNPIIAIDPGPVQSAILEWDGKRVVFAAQVPNSVVLANLKVLDSSCQLCIEMIASYGMPVGAEVFNTCVWIGRFWEAWTKTPRLVYRREVKLHHCGSMKAKDSNIRQALIDKYGAPGTKAAPGVTYRLKADLWAAFGIATYVAETEGQ
jgi:hypothetical protein